MNRKTAVVLFGGQSSEHVVSCMSVVNVINHMNREKYDLLLIGITEEGHWIKVESVEAIESGSWREGTVNAVISPDATKQCVILTEGDRVEFVKADVVFPVLHGLYGEDGTVQGLLELARIPYVGCGVLASAVSMDKLYTKIVVDDLGVRQAAYVPVMRSDLNDMASVNHDRKILVEEMIRGREIECAVFGGGLIPVEASGVGEILAAAEFYDFDAKYYNSDSRTVVNPDLPGDAVNQVREAAKAIFQAVDGYGLARVDFFVKDDGTVVFNEINTLPGFTAISMYPMLWEAAGVTKDQLVDRLTEHAFDRFRL